MSKGVHLITRSMHRLIEEQMTLPSSELQQKKLLCPSFYRKRDPGLIMSFEIFPDLCFACSSLWYYLTVQPMVWALPHYYHHSGFLLPWFMIPLSIPPHWPPGCVSKTVYEFSDTLFLSAETSKSVEWLLRELTHTEECWSGLLLTPWCPVTELCNHRDLWKPRFQHPCVWVPFKAQPFWLKIWFTCMIGIK